MGQYGDIIAYQYSAYLYCPRCIVGLVCEGSDREPVPVPMMAAEQALDYLASQWNIDRNKDSDSDEFPQVVLYDQFPGELLRCGCCDSEIDGY